jgi:hypothetical protein
MAVLSVDLAYRRWSDLGIVLLDRVPRPAAAPEEDSGNSESDQEAAEIRCELIVWNGPGDETVTAPGPVPARGELQRVDPEMLAGRLNHLAHLRNIHTILLDGPQAWKSRNNGLEFARVSERQLNTAAKTGLPGMVKPTTYRAFAEFCLDVYDALARRGWRRLDTNSQPGSAPQRLLVESYPHAAWKSLGLKPLPSKRRARISDLAEALAALRSLLSLRVDHPPNHDQLQAIVGGLPGLALDEHDANGARIFGHPPRREEGHWREGFIVLPLPPNRAPAIRWLH